MFVTVMLSTCIKVIWLKSILPVLKQAVVSIYSQFYIDWNTHWLEELERDVEKFVGFLTLPNIQLVRNREK